VGYGTSARDRSGVRLSFPGWALLLWCHGPSIAAENWQHTIRLNEIGPPPNSKTKGVPNLARLFVAVLFLARRLTVLNAAIRGPSGFCRIFVSPQLETLVTVHSESRRIVSLH
jgi:hypothetical protein